MYADPCMCACPHNPTLALGSRHIGCGGSREPADSDSHSDSGGLSLNGGRQQAYRLWGQQSLPTH
jgi:hypothetical protein